MKQIFRWFVNRKPSYIVLVSGLPRSGTSLLMRMLEFGGIPPLIDHIRIADDDNPKGYYEYERVKKLPNGDVDWLDKANGKAVKIISALLPHLPESHTFKIVFMEREISEILASQQKMLIRRGEDPNKVSDSELSELFKFHLHQTDSWLIEHSHHISYIKISYNKLLECPSPEISRINSFLGGGLNEVVMENAIETALYRNRK